MKRTQALILTLLTALALAPAAPAQSDYPSRPITILVPFPPGGSSDTVIRPIAQKVAGALKATFVIDNRTGAGGNVAALATKQAAPDGYTLFLANNGTLGINVSLFKDLRFDAVKDFQPVTPIVSFPSVLAVPSELPVRSVKDLAALAKTRPNGLNFGSQGVGSGGHILGEMFKLRSGAPMTHVPYRGAAPAVTDLAAGRIDLLFASYISVAGQVQSGKLRLLALTAPKRSPTLPDLPTMAEAGYPGMDVLIWHGLVAPAGTPPAIVRKLNEAFVKAANAPDVVGRVTPQVAEITTSTPDDFAKLIAADIALFAKVIKDAGIKQQ
ncbi:MAG: tripartite tricarboxylate transporter substrate binding protein [Rhizobiales bacterium]|nr:tripartite tricarboxylate transporter substrate binding protein [Hyphomicrobiales bacterium]